MKGDSGLRFGRRRSLPMVRQAENAECGLACLAMVAGYYGYETDLAALRRNFAISMRGATLKSMIRIGSEIGLGSRAVRCDLSDLSQLRTPAILHWRMNHFVVLKKVAARGAHIHDPALGERYVSLADLSNDFTGVALELTPTPSFQPRRNRERLKLSALVRPSSLLGGALGQAVILSLVIEALVLAAPFYLQLILDRSIPTGDLNLLNAAAIGFAVLLAFNVAAKTLRSLVLQFLSTVLCFEAQAGLFSHLLRLPLDWFQKRQVGDIQGRFGSVQTVQNILANGAVSAFFDGLLSIFILAAMLYYSPALALIVIGSLALYLIVVLATTPLARRAAGDQLVAESAEQTRLLETLRAAQTIKAVGGELSRDNLQRNALAERLNGQVRSGNLTIAQASLNQAVSGFADILVVYVGARAVISGSLSVGMLMAFLAYKAQMVDRFIRFIDFLIAGKLLDVQLERIADIALSPLEDQPVSTGWSEMAGSVETRNLAYRYAPSDPPVLQNLNLRIEQGEYVAIIGPSGCGKSTLLKLLSGLYTPTDGEVLVDGRPLNRWDHQSLRRQLAIVAQDDQLLAGSISDNIALFDEAADLTRVAQCAELANIHNEIMAMPMGYGSLIGDMGSSLSGGQKQRVLLARALYQSPKVLILDEGTSHLDIENERAINAALTGLSITRIIVAHRPETIQSAVRVIDLSSLQAGAPAGASGVSSATVAPPAGLVVGA